MKKQKSKPEEQVSLYSLLALLYASQKEYGKADDLLEDALRIIPKEKRAELLQSAMSVYLEALKHASDRKPFPFGWFADSDKEKYTKKFHEVSDEFANILTSPESSLNVDTFMPSAAILRDKGQDDLALLILTSPLFANPGSLQALKRLGAYYYATKNYANAARIWKLILSRQKRVHPYDSYMYASSLLNSGNPKEAVEAFDRHLTLFPKDILPMHPYAASALLAGKNRTAVQIVGKISNPNPETLYIKALAEERLGEYSAALDTMLKYLSLRKFASREERYPVAMQTILIADKAKRYDAAASLLEPMIDEDPENPELLNLFGYIYAEAGIHLKKAGELLTRAVRLAPDNAAILDSMAWLLYRQKQYKEAWEYIQKSLASLPKEEDADAVILDHAGDISLALGRKAEAVRFWKRALSLYSPDADRGKILKKLKNNEKI